LRFAYEWHDDSGQWFRSYGNENWEFNEQGLMMRRYASINDLPIKASDRKFSWPLDGILLRHCKQAPLRATSPASYSLWTAAF
jgi:nuclear transport factor 2 (NTF2) superfamily protein